MNVDMKLDTNSGNIDAQNIIIQTGDGQNNGNDTISSDNTDILDDDLTPSQEIPFSQIPHRNPYIKDDDSNNSACNDLGSENDDNVEDTADSQCTEAHCMQKNVRGRQKNRKKNKMRKRTKKLIPTKKKTLKMMILQSLSCSLRRDTC